MILQHLIYMLGPFPAVSAAAEYAKNIGSKVMQLAAKRSNKSKLIVNPDMAINPVLINCFIEDITLGINHMDGRGFNIPYILNRISIKNDGRVPAEYCEGHIVEGTSREKLPWANVSGGVRILIPAQSTKELDVCAMLYLNPIEFNRINRTYFNTTRLVSLMNKLHVPAVIFPTESGIQTPPSLNRTVIAGAYLVEVNYKNSDALRIPIVIHSQMDDIGLFITLHP